MLAADKKYKKLAVPVVRIFFSVLLAMTAADCSANRNLEDGGDAGDLQDASQLDDEKASFEDLQQIQDQEASDEFMADAGEDFSDIDSGETGSFPDGDYVQDGYEEPQVPVINCFTPPPDHAMRPAPFPVYEGTCPLLVPGRNRLVSSGREREFILVVPNGLSPGESPPLIFLWHWLGGEANDFLEKGQVQLGADQMRFLAAIPEARGDLIFKWPFLITDSESRLEEESKFFDDMLACISQQYNVNANCVSSVGVSAGGLWTSQLAQRRAQHLSSFLSLSGGTGREGDWLNPVRPWKGAAHVMPALVLWGGPTDFCGINFAATSGYLEEALENGGHFIVECIHNCSHAEPPMEAAEGWSRYAFLWEFVLNHPFWLRDGESPYLQSGLPPSAPSWCDIGRGSAQIRQGECNGGLLGDCL